MYWVNKARERKRGTCGESEIRIIFIITFDVFVPFTMECFVKKLVLCFVLFACLSVPYSASAAAYFTDGGSMQIGGNIIFHYESVDNHDFKSSSNEFIINPVVNFFPIRYFLVGPSFNLDMKKNDSYVSLGVNLGFAYGKAPVIPFIYGSPQLVIAEGHGGFGMEFAGGIMIPIQKRFTINIGPDLRFELRSDYSRFDFNFLAGITGWVL